jgi:hypothetical protein
MIEAYVESFLPDDGAYERMKGYDCSAIDRSLPYNEFVRWNIECIRGLTDDDKEWVVGLCKRLKKNTIGLMDLESCAVFVGDCIYFDKNKNLVIANPR